MTEILKIGIPTLTFQILTSLSIALINRAANSYGDAVIAGMGAVTRITSMGTLIVFGFLKGFQPIAGFSYGAKKFNRLREAIKISTLWSTIFCVVVGFSDIFEADYISIYHRERRNGSGGPKVSDCKRFFILPFWVLHSVFILVPRTR